ncbi:hypothetical protein P4200_31305 [Pseudomonas aeruginosa]|nr:hypothetical protein [Pseudomonas aeruginosa]
MTVLIQGAGIAGLALAREFTKAGIDWLLVERASEIRPIGTGITPGEQCVDGVVQHPDLDRLFRRGMPLAGINVYAHDGSMLMSMPSSLGGVPAAAWRCSATSCMRRYWRGWMSRAFGSGSPSCRSSTDSTTNA